MKQLQILIFIFSLHIVAYAEELKISIPDNMAAGVKSTILMEGAEGSAAARMYNKLISMRGSIFRPDGLDGKDKVVITSVQTRTGKTYCYKIVKNDSVPAQIDYECGLTVIP